MKKVSVLALLLIILISITACGTFDGYDSDEAIIKGNSYSTVGSVTSSTSSSYKISVQKFNGVISLKSITLPDNPVFDMTVEIASGNFKVVLVKDNKVITICESNTDVPISLTLEAGTYSLRIVGKDAKVKFTFNYNSYIA